MHQASGAGKRKSPKRSSLLTFVLIGDTGTRRMVLRLACARLHPPPRPPRKPDARCPPPPDGPARDVPRREGRNSLRPGQEGILPVNTERAETRRHGGG